MLACDMHMPLCKRMFVTLVLFACAPHSFTGHSGYWFRVRDIQRVPDAKPRPLCPVKEHSAQDNKNSVTDNLLQSGICMSQASSSRVCILQ